jgi:hypothetical protein
MSNTLYELYSFCRKNLLYFPKFKATYANGSVSYSVEWYSQLIYTSDFHQTDDEALRNCVFFLSDWLKSEKNYLNLLTYEAMSKMNVV